MIDYVVVGKKVRNARMDKNITQTELANELGVSVGYISQIESGDKCFNLKRIEEVANVLGKNIGYFIDGSDVDSRTSMISEIITILNRFDEDNLIKVRKILNIITD